MTDAVVESRGTLPQALLDLIPRRLRLWSLFWGIFWILGLVVPAIVIRLQGGEQWPLIVFVIFGSMSALAFGVAALCHKWRAYPQRLLWVGLAFEVVGAALIASGENMAPYLRDYEMRPGTSWVAVWVVLYPLVVPSRIRHTLVTSILSWATLPGSLYLLSLADMTWPGESVYTSHIVSGLFVVALSVVPQRMVMLLGREVQRHRVMGSYELRERIGHGGMGEVWLARHRLLARPAALKLIRTESSDSGVASSRPASRFEREAQATAALRSPHTVELFDFGVADDGAFYYVMERLEGVDLERLIERFGTVPPERMVSLMLQACHSLDEAHAAGLVHRDIKPANIMVCRYGRDVDFVKLLDFGMVKEVHAPDSRSPKLTADGVVAGTPAYMPPEVATGSHEVGPAADLYALGCVGYWLLTGELVFCADTPMAMAVKHAAETPAPPSQRCDTEIPEALETIVMRCLDKDPAKRFASAAALREALRETGLSDLWTPEHAQSWWDRNLPAGEHLAPESTRPHEDRITFLRPRPRSLG